MITVDEHLEAVATRVRNSRACWKIPVNWDGYFISRRDNSLSRRLRRLKLYFRPRDLLTVRILKQDFDFVRMLNLSWVHHDPKRKLQAKGCGEIGSGSLRYPAAKDIQQPVPNSGCIT